MLLDATLDRRWLPSPGLFGRVWLVMGVGRSAQIVEPFLAVLLLTELQSGPGTVSAALLSYQAAGTLGYMASGWMSQQLGERASVLAAMGTASLACLVLAGSSDIRASFVAALLYGFGSAAWRTGAQAIVSVSLATRRRRHLAGPHASPLAVRARAFSLLALTSSLGALASAVAVALGGSIRWWIGVQAATLAAGVIFAVGLPARVRPAGGEDRDDISRSDSGRVLDRRFVLLLIALAPATAVTYQAFSGLAVVMSPGQYRAMVLLNAVMMVAGVPLFAWMSRRRDAGTVLATASVVLGLAMAIQVVLPGWAPVTVLWTVAEVAVIITPAAIVAGMAPHRQTAAFAGTYQASQGAVAALAAAGGVWLAHAQPVVYAASLATLGLLGAALVTRMPGVVGAALRHPLECPCGALRCRCVGGRFSCVVADPDLGRPASDPTAGPRGKTRQGRDSRQTAPPTNLPLRPGRHMSAGSNGERGGSHVRRNVDSGDGGRPRSRLPHPGSAPGPGRRP